MGIGGDRNSDELLASRGNVPGGAQRGASGRHLEGQRLATVIVDCGAVGDRGGICLAANAMNTAPESHALHLGGMLEGRRTVYADEWTPKGLDRLQ